MRSVLIWLALAILLSACQPLHVNESSEVFLPAELAVRMAALQKFPGAWWNYIVVERPTAELCNVLKREHGLERVGCSYGPQDLRELLTPWLNDLPLRISAPTLKELGERMNLALAKASAPLGSELTEILREDPLGTYAELLSLMQALNPVRLNYRDHFLRFPQSEMAAIPVLFNFPHSETDRTEELRKRVEKACQGNCGELYFIGSHFGTSRNKTMIKEDVGRVTLVGTILFVLFLGSLMVSGRWTVILITIPVGAGVWAAALAVNAWHGSIHGLTLAFGSGLVGIAFDYAFHAFVQNSGSRVWRANLIGYITTLVVFLVLAFSGIPLVREIMVFATLGFSFAFVLFYLVITRTPERYKIRPFPLGPLEAPIAPWLLLGSVLALGGAVVFLHPDFSVQNLDQTSRREKSLTRELFGSGGALPPVVRIHERDVSEEELQREQDFAGSLGMKVVNRLTFLPPIATQRKNLDGWRALACGNLASRSAGGAAKEFSKEIRRFFAPFFDNFSCASFLQREPRSESAYSRAIQGEGKWLSTFFPVKREDEAAIRERFTDSFALSDLVNLFPRMLMTEISWMAPLAFLLVFLIVWAAYRRWRMVLAVFIPWILGAAFSTAGLALSSTGFGFVSLVGLLMVFGTATDYGVFCANFYLNSQLTRKGIWTALAFAGIVTIVGFLPLLFARHIVLRQLGEPLVLGTLGTMLGTFVVEPWWMRRALAR